MPGTGTLHLHGHEIEVKPVEPRPDSGARVDVPKEDGRRWPIDVTLMGTLDAIVKTWHDGILANLRESDWVDDTLARLARAV